MASIPEDDSLHRRSIFHQVTEDILLFGPILTRFQSGTVCATGVTVLLLTVTGLMLLFSNRPWHLASLADYAGPAAFFLLLVLVATQLIFPKRFLFQSGPSFAILDRRRQRVYWAHNGKLVPAPWNEVRSAITTTQARLPNQPQWIHRTFVRLQAGDAAIDVPVFVELDSALKSREVAVLALTTVSGFMRKWPLTQQELEGAGLSDLRQQREESILVNMCRLVVGHGESGRNGLLRFAGYLLLALPLAAVLYVHKAFDQMVRLTSTAAAWPDDLLKAIGPIHPKSTLKAIIDGKV